MSGRTHLDELDDEIRDHLDRETQNYIDRGMTPEAAYYAARRKPSFWHVVPLEKASLAS
jgi:hypothetical protein